MASSILNSDDGVISGTSGLNSTGGSALVMEITLKLTVEEVNGILQTLGQLPTSSGAWPLVVKIKEQAESQIPKESSTEQ